MAATLEQLQAFVETVDQGSFKKAGLRLGKHNTTISGLVAALEAELGLELFIRKPRSLEVTSHGHDIYQPALSLLRENEHFLARVNSLLAGLPSKMTIAFDTGLRHPNLAAIFTRFQQVFPSVELTLLSGGPMQVRSWLLSSQADIGISLNTVQRHYELNFADCYSFNIIAVASPSLGFNERVVSMDELRGQTQVSALFMTMLGLSDTHNYSNRCIYSNNVHDTLSIVASGSAWAFVPEFICLEAIKNKEVEKFYVTEVERTRPSQWTAAIYWLDSKPMNKPMTFFLEEATKLPNLFYS